MSPPAALPISAYPKPAMISIYALGLFLGLLHIFLASVAIFPQVSPDYHRDIKIQSNAFAKNFLSFIGIPFTSVVSLANVARFAIATFQFAFGILLLENEHVGRISLYGNCGLVVLNINHLIILLIAGVPIDRLAPTIVFLILLVTRLIIMKMNTKNGGKTTKGKASSKPKTSTPKKSKNE